MSDLINVPMAETLRGIRRRAGYATVDALATALEMEPYRILRFEAALFKVDESGDQELVDHYGELARGQHSCVRPL